MFGSRAEIARLEADLNALKGQNEELLSENQRLQSLVTPEAQRLFQVRQESEKLIAACKERAAEVRTLFERKAELESEIARKHAEAKAIERKIGDFNDEILVQEFGLYQPRYEFANSLGYKNMLADVRQMQRKMLLDFNKSLDSTNLTFNNSAAKGRTVAKSVGKLIMRAYNSECDEIIRKVKYSNIERSIEQIQKRARIISTYAESLQITIPTAYVDLKVKEARLAFEWAMQKEKEKEELREERARRREEAQLRKELAEERKKLTKEKKHYLHAYRDVTERLDSASDLERPYLEERAAEIEGHLTDIDKAFRNVDYREANQRAGFVYVISNIGSFGENVYKIGMTRRLDPMERIRELSDASVPFNFDVHAMMFSDDAPALEAALHREFESRKINLVNMRREFFSCTLEEIEDVVRRNYDKTVEFIAVPDAEQFRVSREMRQRDGNSLPVDVTTRGYEQRKGAYASRQT